MNEQAVTKRLEQLSKDVEVLLTNSRQMGDFVPTSDDNVISSSLLNNYEQYLAEQKYYQKALSAMESETISSITPYESRDVIMELSEEKAPVEVVAVTQPRTLPIYMTGDDLNTDYQDKTEGRAKEEPKSLVKSLQGTGMIPVEEIQAALEVEVADFGVLPVREILELSAHLSKQTSSSAFQQYVWQKALSSASFYTDKPTFQRTV